MDFYKIKERTAKNGVREVYPDFIVQRSRDLMVLGKSFYAIWDQEVGLWSRDEYDVQRLIDQDLMDYRARMTVEGPVHIRLMSDFSSNTWADFRRYLSNIADNAKTLDARITFANTNVKKTDYVSRRLRYSLVDEEPEAYNKLMSVLYTPKERKKLEWAVGAILVGDAKDIQKFIVIYGEGGSGKSTFLNILQMLFEGYYTTFEARALTGSSNTFATEAFRGNPLVALQHDGDLSGIGDNSKLNSIVSHEEMVMNEKYKPSYTARANAFLFMATNKPVHITDAKSGIIRRLIDVSPSGKTVPVLEYHSLMGRITFELGAIANHCIAIYQSMGKNFYSAYKPISMILQTDVFFNFVESNFYSFLEEDSVTLSQAYALYKEYCEESLVKYVLPKYKFRDELANYFLEFLPVARVDGKQVRSLYRGFIAEKFQEKEEPKEEPEEPSWIVLDQKVSLFDSMASEYSAQYASMRYETPLEKWDDVTTRLKELDTSLLHFVKLPENHIVIDFDIVDEDGNKSPEMNMRAASKWPPTYAEYSKSGAGLHLHYIWARDTSELTRIFDEHIEVKVFSGNASLRRKLSLCNSLPIATINSGIPKREVRMLNREVVMSEKGLRDLIWRNLRKEIHPNTKPSIDFIYKILEEAHASGIPYDVRDLRPKVLLFANNSTNNAPYCMKLVTKMRFNSEDDADPIDEYDSEELVFFDVEVFPNLFIISWKYAGPDKVCVHMINPTPQEIEGFMRMKLIGFNNRRYDNHIIYAAFLGYSNTMLFEVSSKIIGGAKRAMFREAYNLSYADVYDFASKKQSLKKWQLELGIHHQELPFPWDEPISEEHWPQAIEYCDNDVMATEAVFNERKEDYTARRILADLSGLTVNSSTLSHTSKIIFGEDRNPQNSFVYTDLSEEFPGYSFNLGKSSYRGEDPGEGGYVYSEPGYYTNVALLDVASMHPTSIQVLNLFGPYTSKYTDLIKARLAIKHGDFEKAISILPNLEKYLGMKEDSQALSYALKIVINIVYGLTSASFDNPFRDDRNLDNIVAKRGALFMIDLKHELQDRGVTVVHIKTDSVKIPDASKELIDFVFEFGRKYGYTFEHEATYEKFLLVNDAVYVAKDQSGHWTATGAEFQHSVIFKKLFSREALDFRDYCEMKTVTTSLYLDLNEGLSEEEHNYHFVGRAGSFVPIAPGRGGGILLRKKDDKYYAATGTKGWRWLESEYVREFGKEGDINKEYYRHLVDEAIRHIEEFVPLDVLLD